MLELISTIKIILDIWNVVVWDMNYINSLRPSDAYLRQPPRPSMIDAKPLYEPMLTYCQWNPWKRSSVEIPSKHNNLHKKCFWKCRLQYDCHVVSAHFFQAIANDTFWDLAIMWIGTGAVILQYIFNRRFPMWRLGAEHISDAHNSPFDPAFWSG